MPLETARGPVTDPHPLLTDPHPLLTAARRANAAKATAARWPDGPGPITHGTSSTMAARCRQENGRACQVCRDAEAARSRARYARFGRERRT